MAKLLCLAVLLAHFALIDASSSGSPLCITEIGPYNEVASGSGMCGSMCRTVPTTGGNAFALTINGNLLLNGDRHFTYLPNFGPYPMAIIDFEGHPFTGFVLTTMTENDVSGIGEFDAANSTEVQSTDVCGPENSALTQVGSDNKTWVEFTWSPPPAGTGNVTFLLTVIRERRNGRDSCVWDQFEYTLVEYTDLTPPLFTSCPPTAAYIVPLGAVDSAGPLIAAIDNYSAVNISNDHNTANFAPGAYDVIFTATDAAGNTAVCHEVFQVYAPYLSTAGTYSVADPASCQPSPDCCCISTVYPSIELYSENGVYIVTGFTNSGCPHYSQTTGYFYTFVQFETPVVATSHFDNITLIFSPDYTSVAFVIDEYNCQAVLTKDPTCSDGILNGDELTTDYGGSCDITPPSITHCPGNRVGVVAAADDIATIDFASDPFTATEATSPPVSYVTPTNQYGVGTHTLVWEARDARNNLAQCTSTVLVYVDECLSNPCLNRGLCDTSFPGGPFSCECPSQYSGERCQIRPLLEIEDDEGALLFEAEGSDEVAVFRRDGVLQFNAPLEAPSVSATAVEVGGVNVADLLASLRQRLEELQSPAP